MLKMTIRAFLGEWAHYSICTQQAQWLLNEIKKKACFAEISVLQCAVWVHILGCARAPQRGQILTYNIYVSQLPAPIAKKVMGIWIWAKSAKTTFLRKIPDLFTVLDIFFFASKIPLKFHFFRQKKSIFFWIFFGCKWCPFPLKLIRKVHKH